MDVLDACAVFGAGLLAGIEVAVRFGVRSTIDVLAEQPQIRLRQALIRTLRVLVPSVYLPTFGLGIAVTVLAGSGFRYAGISALLVWTVTTFTGTVPLNKALLAWQPDAPPANWRAVIRRWKRMDTVRTWAAVLAFAGFLAALA
jgi:uncharacterized membrane protein